MLLVLSVTSAYAQTVSGKVTSSEDGTALPGVNIIEQGTTNGTVSDMDGNYRLNISSDDAVLVFSFIGYVQNEIPTNGQSQINVTLVPDTRQLSEVVVTGYGTQLKQDLTGNIAKVSGEEVQNVPVPTFESAIQGRAAGVFIEAGNGKLGEAIKVRVRGSSSISASNQPLYVVDGIPVTSEDQGTSINQPTNPLVDLNFNDVESIEVLKDASAAAIYGSRAANGVIIITTKRGEAGKTRINAGYQYGFSQPTNKVGFLNAAEYRELYTEATLRYLEYDPITATQAQRIEAADFLENVTGLIPGFLSDSTTDTNWEDLAFQDAPFNQFNLSAQGGDEKTQFYTGFTFLDQSGILIGNELSKISGRINLDHNATDKLKFGGGLNIVRTLNDRVSNDNAFSTPMQLVALAPMNPAYDPETGEPNENTIYYNGLIEAENAFFNTETWRTFGNLYAGYQILPGLNFRSEFGLDVLNQSEEQYQGRDTQDGAPRGQGYSRANQVINYNTNNYFNYQNNSSDVHSIGVDFGMSFQSSSNYQTSAQAIGFPDDRLNTLVNATETISFGSSEDAFTFLSYFLRSNYKYQNKYLLTLSGRVDASSKFSADNRYGFFPAVSVGWILTEESFLQESPLLSFLKLRASYGITGNAPSSNFASLALYEGVNYAGTSGLGTFSLPSPDLKWETTAQTDIGIDFGLFDDRLTGEMDVYYKYTTDLLLNKTLPATSGYTSIFKNIGTLENKGLEIVLNSQNLVGAFAWSTNFNIAFNRNKVLDIEGTDITAEPNRVREGEPLGVFVTRKYENVNPENGNPWYNDGEGGKTEDYNAAPNLVVGDPNPNFVGGFTNDFQYKGFDLNVFFQFVYGNEIYNSGREFQANNASGFVDNQTKDQLRRWRQQGDVTDVPRAELVAALGSQTSSRYIYDGSYLRLKTVSLGYNFSTSMLERVALRSLRLYVTAQNLLTFTDYPGWDPEVNYLGTGRTQTNVNLIQGIDFYTAPQARTITFGVNIGF